MNQSPSMNWSVVCDFDGTISLKDTTDALLEAFADPAWHDIEDRWVAGEIGSAECMQQQVALLNVSKDELDAWLDEVKIDPHFREFVRFCNQYGVPLEIASDGIDYVIHRVLKANGLNYIPVTANRLFEAEDRSWRLESPGPRCVNGQGVCKCVIINEVRSTESSPKVLFVGDGRSDFCVSEKVDLVAAKASLLKHCQQLGLTHKPFDDFRDVTAITKELIFSIPQSQIQPAMLVATA